MRGVDVADLPLGQPRHLPFQILHPVRLGSVVEQRALGVVFADGVVVRAVDVLRQAFCEGDAGVPVRVAGDVGGEGWVLGTLGGRGGRVGGGGGEGAGVEAD